MLKVARIVGHSSLLTTLRYTRLVITDLKDTIESHPLNKRKEIGNLYRLPEIREIKLNLN